MAEISQKMVLCPQGHYYDANRYAACPHCSPEGFAPTEDPYADAPMKQFGSAAPYENQGQYFAGMTEPAEIPGNSFSDQMKPTEFFDPSTPEGMPSPVVGWLVAVGGPCRGTDYRIHTGFNYIGRNYGDICINGDNTISGEKDSVVAYIPQTNKFYIAHELGKNPILVNSIPVIGGSVELHDYDVVTIGSTTLRFVGFCGEEFTWEGNS